VRKLAIVPLLAVLLIGCGLLGVPSPQTFNQRAAAAVSTVNTASQSALTLLQARKITPNESDQYIDQIEDVQEAIDVARAVYATDPSNAEDRLALTINALNLLVAELEKRK
jgi:Tfp pilus assembly protein PilV